jgi:uncharacterized membrane protein
MERDEAAGRIAEETMADATVFREPDPSLITVTQVTYALHALGLAIGAFGASTIVGSFVFGWPSIIAVIINYVKRSDARGTWLESHFTWQIRTFWFAMLWAAIIVVAGLALAIVLVGFAIWIVGLFVLGIWAIYRIVSGWMRLQNRQPMWG